MELKELMSKVAVRCKTIEDATWLDAYFKTLGVETEGFERVWSMYSEDTCYDVVSEIFDDDDEPHLSYNYCYKDWYEEHNYRIIDCEDLFAEHKEAALPQRTTEEIMSFFDI